MTKQLLLALLAISMLSCSGKKEEETTTQAARAGFSAESNFVDTMVLRRMDFSREIVTNGKLRALRKSSLTFRSTGVLASILVKNGDYVGEGQVIARLDTSEAYQRMKQAEERREKAELDFADKLISYGYGRDTANVPADMLRVIKIQSGYNQVIHDYKKSVEELASASLRAPFGGKVANVSAREYESPSGPFCTLIDDSSFEVEFSLLESELSFLGKGSQVRVASFSEPDVFYEGNVTQINPVVDEKGQITVMAKVSNNRGKLMEGMNVKVVARNIVKNQLVVPKSSVVMRDNFDVLFRLDPNTGKAMWTYVEVLMTNTGYHSVIANKEKNAKLDEGDVVIVSGNLNLADGSNVEVKK